MLSYKKGQEYWWYVTICLVVQGYTLKLTRLAASVARGNPGYSKMFIALESLMDCIGFTLGPGPELLWELLGNQLAMPESFSSKPLRIEKTDERPFYLAELLTSSRMNNQNETTCIKRK